MGVNEENRLGLDPAAALHRVVCVDSSQSLSEQDPLANGVGVVERPRDEFLPDDLGGLRAGKQPQSIDQVTRDALGPAAAHLRVDEAFGEAPSRRVDVLSSCFRDRVEEGAVQELVDRARDLSLGHAQGGPHLRDLALRHPIATGRDVEDGDRCPDAALVGLGQETKAQSTTVPVVERVEPVALRVEQIPGFWPITP